MSGAFFPDWPQVRCQNCATVYTYDANGGATAAKHCPKCGTLKFNTSMTVPAGSVSPEAPETADTA